MSLTFKYMSTMQNDTTSPVPGYVMAGASIGAEIYNTASTRQNNKDQLKYNREQYERERADNLAQWHLQNKYNSPAEQMKRFQEAGLNPHLIYGQGAGGGNASPIPSAKAQSYNPQAPQLNLGNSLAIYQDTQLKSAQLDNLKAQNTVLLQDAALKASSIGANNAKTATTQFQLQQAERLKDISADYAAENLRKIQLSNTYSVAENERREIHTKLNIAENTEKILTMRLGREKAAEEIKRLKQQINFEELELKLKRNGIQSSDPIYLRVLGQILGNAFDGTILDPKNLK